MGLIFAGISFTIFAIGAQSVAGSEKIPLFTIVMGNWILGVGELFLLPVMLTSISQLMSANLQGTFMGIFFLSEAFSSYLASIIARVIDTTPAHAVTTLAASHYAHGFFQLSYLILGIGGVAIVLTPWLKYLLEEKIIKNEEGIPV